MTVWIMPMAKPKMTGKRVSGWATSNGGGTLTLGAEPDPGVAGGELHRCRDEHQDGEDVHAELVADALSSKLQIAVSPLCRSPRREAAAYRSHVDTEEIGGGKAAAPGGYGV